MGVTNQDRNAPRKENEVTDADLIALAPDDFKPTPMMLRFVRARMTEPEQSNTTALAASAGIGVRTIYQWYQRHPLYYVWEARCLMYLCRRAVPRVWAVILQQAEAGCKVSQKRILDRYDLGMKNPAAREPERPSDDVDAAFTRAEAAAHATGPRNVAPRRAPAGGTTTDDPQGGTSEGPGGGQAPPSIYRDSPPAPDDENSSHTKGA